MIDVHLKIKNLETLLKFCLKEKNKFLPQFYKKKFVRKGHK